MNERRYGKYLVEVLDVQFTPGLDPTVDVSDAYVKLKANVVPASYQYFQSDEGKYMIIFTTRGRQLQRGFTYHPDTSLEITKFTTERKVTCMLFKKYYKGYVPYEDILTMAEMVSLKSVACFILEQVESDLPIRYRIIG